MWLRRLRSLCKSKKICDLTPFIRVQVIEQHSNVTLVKPPCEKRSKTHKARASSVKENETVKRDQGPAAA
jgi:hypothetical protein